MRSPLIQHLSLHSNKIQTFVLHQTSFMQCVNTTLACLCLPAGSQTRLRMLKQLGVAASLDDLYTPHQHEYVRGYLNANHLLQERAHYSTLLDVWHLHAPILVEFNSSVTFAGIGP